MKLKLLFFFLSGYTVSQAQYQQMLHQPYKDKVEGIDRLYNNTINRGHDDSLYVTSFTQQMERWAKSNNDEELALEAELLRTYSHWFLDGYKEPELVQNLIDVAEKAENEGVPHIEERAVKVIATHYWALKNYEQAFEWLLRSASILEKMEAESFPNMAEHLNFIGRCYYYFEDYSSAVSYFKKSSQLNKTAFNAEVVFEAQTTLGLCYQELKQLTLAEQYFLEVINDTSAYAATVWKGIAAGNLGYNKYLEGNDEKAVPLLKEDIQNALAINDYGLAAGSAIPLADIYLQQHQLQASKQKIEEAKDYIRRSGQTDRLRKLYPVLSKWYAANNQIDSSAAYLDAAMEAANDYSQKYSSLKLLRANQKVDARERQLAIEKLTAESRVMISRRNSVIVFIVMLLLGTMLSFWFRNKYLIKKQQVKELMLESAQEALFRAKSQLQNLALKAREDNKLMLELQKSKVVESNQQLFSQLRSKSILTQEDWVQYQGLFNQVYPSFSPSLMTSYPHLSQAEIRCLYLEKLQLSNNEMALVLGVSTNAMRVTKHRIRRKLGLESQEEMEALIQQLG